VFWPYPYSKTSTAIIVGDLITQLKHHTKRCWLRLLLLVAFDSLAVLASNNFDTWRADTLIGFHLERGVLDDERPDVIAEPVGVEMALESQVSSKDSDGGQQGRLTLSDVFAFTCLTIVSARLLSNCAKGQCAVGDPHIGE
jgi:hypothetical protein